MRIIFVMGPTGGGKSYYIENNLKDFVKVDLYDFQKNNMTYDEVWESYMKCKDKLIEEIKKGNDVVLEHTLLKGIRREIYINAVKEISDVSIEAVWIFPDIEKYKENSLKRFHAFSQRMYDEFKEVSETPTVEEGFSSVLIMTSSHD